ncbi:S-4TM family putative pore-forming effector, partial [Brachyspira murdochii]|uniref:S-4TM family putative pore-forming effector n=1 Tax=Brachyspira murdochii TaxID=84378 RepID=UPI001CA48284
MVSTINELEEKQNEESNIKLLAAQRTLYNKARFYQVIIFFIPILLPVILSIVKLYYKNNIIDFSLNILNICSIAIYMLIYNKIDKLKE